MRWHVSNQPRHRPDQIRAIPGRTEHMHPTELHNPVDTVAGSRLRQSRFLRDIAYRQSKCLDHAVKSCDWVQKALHLEDAESSALCGGGNV